MAWFDFLNQANPTGRDAGSIARQRLSARGAIPAAKPGLPRGAGLLTGVTVGSLLGDYVAAPLAVGLGDYLRTGQGQLLKDRLRQGDIGGAFTAVTGIGRSNAPVLNQYNPPGFVPGSQVTSADILKSATEVAKQRPKTRQPADTQEPAPGIFDPYAAQNRAYQQERARVEAMVKANPDMQKQEIADARAKVRDQGMAIWQQKYGNTPMGQPGGAVGRFNPLMERTFGYQTGMAPDQIAAMQETAAPVQVAPGEIPYQQGDLGTRATLETGYDPAQYGLSPNLVEEMKKRLLQQAGK